MGKVLSLVTTSKGPVSDDLLASIESFTEVVTRDKARAYAAVAIDEDGRVIDTWFSALPHVALIEKHSLTLIPPYIKKPPPKRGKRGEICTPIKTLLKYLINRKEL